jgi:cytochrome c oxidase subunit IV
MSTTTDDNAAPGDHAGHDDPLDPASHTSGEPAVNVDGSHVVAGEHEPHSDKQYVVVAIALAVMTGAEVALSYTDVGVLFLPLLLTLMVVKFFTVVLYFMHLKFDSKWFSFFFYTGLFLAVGCYMAFLSTFKFFGN